MSAQPLTLALETSTVVGSVALGEGATLLAEVVLGERTRHSEQLLPAIESLLRSTGVARTDLQRVVLGGGPGSFTGLRLAAATAKGLAAALELPCFAYSGLLTVAAGIAAGSARAVCTLFDARHNQVYAACYRLGEEIETLRTPGLSTIDDVLREEMPGQPLFAGDGARKQRDRIRAEGGIVLPMHMGIPRASTLLWLAETEPAAGRIERPSRWEPDYLRASNAERGVRA